MESTLWRVRCENEPPRSTTLHRLTIFTELRCAFEEHKKCHVARGVTWLPKHSFDANIVSRILKESGRFQSAVVYRHNSSLH